MTNPLIAARDAFAAARPEARITLNGRDWGIVDTAGPGPALVFLPGTLGRADIFFQQIEALEPQARVMALSYPASGGVAEWTKDLVVLLDRLELDAVAVLGSSLGGYLAQSLACAHPSRVRHLFAANTLHSVAGIDQRPPYALDLARAPIDDLRAGFATALHGWQASHPDQADLVALLLGEVAGRIPDGEMRARLAAIKHGPALPAHPVSVAATVIESADDPLIPPPLRDGVRGRLTGAAAFRFLWGGHFPYLLRPALYGGLIAARLGLQPMAAHWQGNEVRQA
ncbi:MAG: alpha/beta fold hydrolase [Pararhodobacter sp.]